MDSSIYITDDQFSTLLERLNVEFRGESGEDEKEELLDRAVGEFEGDMVERYVVPLESQVGGTFESAPDSTKRLVLSTIKAKIRHLLGTDKLRNVVVDGPQRFIDLHKSEYEGNVKRLLDPKKDFRLKLNQAAEGAVVPIQEMGIARADDKLHPELDTQDIVF